MLAVNFSPAVVPLFALGAVEFSGAVEFQSLSHKLHPRIPDDIPTVLETCHAV